MQIIRGAISVDKNEKTEILNKTNQMLEEIIAKNNILIDDILSIHFTATNDLTAVYPAVAARQMNITQAALMCTQEMYVEGSLKMCIRCAVMVDTAKKQSEAIAVYLGAAKALRPDLAKTAITVAIDGPAGSGKSSVAKEIAKRLNLIYVDTGAMYRAVGLYCKRKNIDTKNAIAVEAILPKINLEIKLEKALQIIIVNGDDYTQAVRTQEAGQAASDVAAILPVRQRLVEIQRHLADGNSIIMDGRDIGTNVLPNANVKIYLDASVDTRTVRRLNELEKLGQKADFDIVKLQISTRDFDDINRTHNPLTKATDAILVDTSNMDMDEVIDKLIQIIEEKIKTCRV